jgi:hypothetical protein
MLGTVIVVVLILLLVGAIPGAWPHSKEWGKGPVGLLMLVLVICEHAANITQFDARVDIEQYVVMPMVEYARSQGLLPKAS